MQKHKIKIVVPVNTNNFNDRILEAIKPVVAPDFEVDIENITEGTPFIESRYAIATNTPAVIHLVNKAQSDGYEGVFVCDFDMTGVEPAREVVDIPVIGGYRASALTAIALARKFSIITVVDNVVVLQEDHNYTFGIRDNFASIHAIDVPVNELHILEKVRSAVFEKALICIEQDGADAIIFGCTGFMDVARYVHDELKKYNGSNCHGIKVDGYDIPVLDPNQTAVAYLQMLVRTGQSQSKISYMHPPNLLMGGSN